MSNIASDIQMPYGEAKHRRPALPFKLEDRLGLPPEVRVTVSFEEYIELAAECEYKVEYHNGQAVSIFDYDAKTKTVSVATYTHEVLVANLSALFFILFREYSNITTASSNASIFIEEGFRTYQADMSVVEGEPNIIRYKHNKKTVNALTNPCIVVEVLSQGTKHYDLVEKLTNYRKIPSLQQVIFVEQYYTQVITYIRQEDNHWLNIELNDINDTLPIIKNNELALSDIYLKVKFSNEKV
jgi:Uma2 family endonuclease